MSQKRLHRPAIVSILGLILTLGTTGAWSAGDPQPGSQVRPTPPVAPVLLAIGSPAPDFTLKDQTGALQRGSELWKASPLVLYFYPADFTPGCTKEAHAFAEVDSLIRARGARLVGVSVDPVESHARFAEHCGAAFPLLADTTAAVARAYGAAFELNRDGRSRTVARRVTYLIDSRGTIARSWVVSDPLVHPQEVVSALSPEKRTP